jgi:O-antigen ligase
MRDPDAVYSYTKLKHRQPVLTATAWVAALFLACSVFSHTVALRLLLLAAGIVLASIAVAKEKEIRAVPPVWIPFLLWGAWALFSYAWSMEPERTLKEWRNEVFYTAAGLWVCYVGSQARSAARVFLPVVAAAAVAACAIALRDFARGGQDYAAGWHGGPGDHSSALLVLAPCAVMAAWYLHRAGAPRWQAMTPWLVAALLLTSSYYTLNRTVWAGLVAEALLIGALLLRRSRALENVAFGTGAKIATSSVAVVVVATGLALMLHVHAQREAVVDPASLTRDSRLEVWRETVERVAEKPLVGYGFGRGILREELRAELHGSHNLWHAHNYFLDALLQIGVPGLLLFLLLLAVTVREGWRASRDPDYGVAACAIALLGVVAGTVVRNMTDTILVRQNALLFWGVVGALLAAGSRSRRT